MAQTHEFTNEQLATIFNEIGDRLEIKGDNPFKIRAYRKGADALLDLQESARRVWEENRLDQIEGIGEAISSKIDELFRTGRLNFLEKLKAEIPEAALLYLRLPDVGPKTARALYTALGSLSLEELETAARAGKLQSVQGIGAKSEAKLAPAIQRLRQRLAEPPRYLLGNMWPLAVSLRDQLQATGAFANVEVVGSLRRRMAMVGGIDMLVATSAPAEAVKVVQEIPAVGALIAADETVARFRLQNGVPFAVYITPPERWGSALHFYTGSRAHLTAGYGVARRRKVDITSEDAPIGAYADEADLFQALKAAWIPPEMREGQDEWDAALEDDLPELVRLEDIRGDLHSHSVWSDGAGTLAEMAAAARARGYEYLVVTDHSESATIANGLSVERLALQRIEILNINSKYSDFRLLQGAEVEIRADGSLDYPDEVLAMLDVVVASLHVSLRQERDQVMRRVLNALNNPHVDILGHPTGRLLGRRDGADLDMEEVIRVAAETGTALEINAHPERLDLDAKYVRHALEMGCLISIDADAHAPAELGLLEYGIWQARRGWATPDDVLNTRPLADLLDYFHRDEDEIEWGDEE